MCAVSLSEGVSRGGRKTTGNPSLILILRDDVYDSYLTEEGTALWYCNENE